MIAKCNACGFNVPWDEIGQAIMQQHLTDEHGVRPLQPVASIPWQDKQFPIDDRR